MWNLTPESLLSAKEELKGRQAAIQARLSHELGTLEADLEEIETLERLAYAFAVKHLSDGEVVAEVRQETIALLESVAVAEAVLDDPHPASAVEHSEGSEGVEADPKTLAVFAVSTTEEAEVSEPFPQTKGDKGTSSRWRVRVGSDAGSQ
jgi:hypothetical protein